MIRARAGDRLRARRGHGRRALRPARGRAAAKAAAKLLEIPRGDRRRGAGARARRTAAWSPTRSMSSRCVFLAGLYRAERAIATRLTALLGRAPALAARSMQESAIAWAEQAAGIALAREPAGGRSPGAASKAAGHHRRPGRRQDDAGQRHPAHPAAPRAWRSRSRPRPAGPPSGCSEATGLEAKTHPSPARDRSRPKGGFRRNEEQPARRATCSWSTRPRWSTCR